MSLLGYLVGSYTGISNSPKKNKMFLKSILLLHLAGLPYVLSGKQNLIIRTTTGDIRGKVNQVLNGEVHAFLGIPYATPPVGDLRFRDPVPVKPWDNIYDAFSYPVSCIQYRAVPLPWIAFPPYSEDCLYLNVWVPVAAKMNPEPKAILVRIHGGGLYSGSSNMEIYDGSILARYGKIIVASMNYRVGVFGFLNAGINSAPGNMGMMDQIMALQWIKDNAVAFGGDPDLITLSGQSMGSVSIEALAMSPLSRGLFRRCIMMAGNMYQSAIEGDNQLEAVVKGDKFARAVGCSNRNISIVTSPQKVVECLKRMNAEELAKAESEFWESSIIWFNLSYDTKFLPLNPIIAIREKRFHVREILTGFNGNEGALFSALMVPMLQTEEALRLTVSQAKSLLPLLYPGQLSTFPTLSEISEEYFENKDITSGSGDVLRVLYKSYGDALFICPTVLFSVSFSDLNSSLYLYIFTHRPSNSQWRPWMGVVHFDENQFQFGIPLKNSTLYTEEEINLSRTIMGVWTSFVRTGKPELPDGMDWPRFNKKYRRHLHIQTDRLTIEHLSVDEHCRFWERNFA